MNDNSETGIFERPFGDDDDTFCEHNLDGVGMSCGAIGRVSIGNNALCWAHAEATALALRQRYETMVDRIRAFKNGGEPK